MIRPVPLGVQDMHIKGRFQGFTSSWGKDKHEMVWLGNLQPTIESPVYKIRIRYRLGGIPKIRILSPTLKPKPPHTYSDGSLCLYTPGEGSWREDKLLADTILPWAAIWLYYYELWVDTDKWQGPETPHGPSPIDIKREEKSKGRY